MSAAPLNPLLRRALFALARPLVRFAATSQLTLAELRKIVDAAYYAELRRRELTVREICALLDISPSKAALLAQSLRQALLDGPPDPKNLDADTLALLLWHEPLSLAKLNQVLPGARYATLRSLLEQLVSQGRIRAEHRGSEAPYRLVSDTARREDDRWIERLEQLAVLLEEAAEPIAAHAKSAESVAVSASKA